MNLPANLPFTEALDHEAARELLPTELRTELLQLIPAQLRARARFSAAMVHADYLADIDSIIERIVSGELDTATALLEMDQSLQSLGYDRAANQGSLTDHRSYARRKLILDTTVAQAGNYGQWVQNNTEVARDLYPCWEYYRAIDANEPRDWESRWLAAGGSLYGGRMMAAKDDPIWMDPILNRFGTPYPPFDFNSGMRLRPVDRDTAVSLGVIEPTDQPRPPDANFLAESPAAANLPQPLRNAVAESLQGVAEFGTDGVLRQVQGGEA